MPRESLLLCADRAFIPHAPPDTRAFMLQSTGGLRLGEALALTPDAEAEDFSIRRTREPAEADVQHDTWGAHKGEVDRILDAELWGVHNLDAEGELQTVQAALIENELDEFDELSEETQREVAEFWETRKKFG